VEEYLAELAPERAAVVGAVRAVLDRLPEGYVERMNWGMISYEIAPERYSTTYNGRPLAVAGLAAQARYYSLYLNCAYADPEVAARLRADYAAAGVKLDMGKSCVRFRDLDGIVLDAVARAIAAVPPERMIELYERSRRR
jgi:hypothetical protein